MPARPNALERQGARDRSTQRVTASIDTLAGQADPTAPDSLAAEAYGMLHLPAGWNAAQARCAADARDHLREAEAIAQRTGERNTMRLHFGPTNVAISSVGHLDRADRIAPVLVRNDPIARDLVVVLDRRARRRVWELDSLCSRFGIGRPGSTRR